MAVMCVMQYVLVHVYIEYNHVFAMHVCGQSRWSLACASDVACLGMPCTFLCSVSVAGGSL